MLTSRAVGTCVDDEVLKDLLAASASATPRIRLQPTVTHTIHSRSRLGSQRARAQQTNQGTNRGRGFSPRLTHKIMINNEILHTNLHEMTLITEYKCTRNLTENVHIWDISLHIDGRRLSIYTL